MSKAIKIEVSIEIAGVVVFAIGFLLGLFLPGRLPGLFPPLVDCAIISALCSVCVVKTIEKVRLSDVVENYANSIERVIEPLAKGRVDRHDVASALRDAVWHLRDASSK